MSQPFSQNPSESTDLRILNPADFEDEPGDLLSLEVVSTMWLTAPEAGA